MPEHDVELVRRFIAFAAEPSAATQAAVPFTTEVQLGLGPALTVTLDSGSVAQPEAWEFEVDVFRAYNGTFSALRLIKGQIAETGSRSVGSRSGAFQVSVGEHPHCVSPPMPAPAGHAHLRRVSIQPSEESMDSCLLWFTVDLFVDRGKVAAVTLDLYEP